MRKSVLFLFLTMLVGLLLGPGLPPLRADAPHEPAEPGKLTSIVPPPPQVVDRLRAEGQPLPPLAQFKASPSPVEPKKLLANVNLLVIMVDFSDNPATVTNLTAFDNLVFAPQVVGRGSVRDYYADVSYGNVDLVTLNLPSATGWQRATQTYAYYVNGQYGWGWYPQNAGRMVEDILPLVDPLVDFADYDNDGDGQVDTLLIVHAGTGAEFSANANDIWSHASSIYNMGGTVLPYDGVWVDNYVTAPEGWDFITPGQVTPSVTDMTIGVICHEIAHGLWGMPDLYDVDLSSNGIGQWGLMSYGDWNGPAKWDPYLGYNVTSGSSPALPTAWSRLVMGFDTYFMALAPVQTTLLPAETLQGQIIRLKSLTLRAQESFLLENRWKLVGGYDEYLPGSGLLIWHVDEAMWSLYGGTDNDNECTTIPHCSGACATTHYLVALEQADGADHLENNVNRGDTGDPFPGSTGRTFWRPYTTVPANPESGSWYDTACNTSSCIDVINIGTSPPNVNLDINQAACTPAEADLGDAPASLNNHGNAPMTAYYPIGPLPYVQANYPTVYAPIATTGPRHHFAWVDSWLGNVSTVELNADWPPDQDGVTNIDPPNDIPDQDSVITALGRDDGVSEPVALTHCSPLNLPYLMTVNSPVVYSPMWRFVNVWFDWNRDGDWADTLLCPGGVPAPEWAVQDQVLSLGLGTYALLSPAFVPKIAVVEDTPFETWMRISVAEMTAPTPYDGRGPLLGYDLGETEDYHLGLDPWLEKVILNPGDPLPGQQVIYQIHYNGSGNVAATGVVLSDVLPLGIEYVGSTPPGSYDPGTRTVSWGTNLTPNQPGSVDLIVQVTGAPSETITNTAYLLWGGAIWKRASASFHVGCPPNDPQAAFTWSQPACVDQTVAFTDLSSGTLPLTYAWDLDGDGLPDSSQQNPTWQYATPGTYTVSLTVDNLCGSDSATEYVSVLSGPVADFEQSHTSAWVHQTIYFTDTSQGNPIAWAWDLDGDGLVDSSQQNPTWQYDTPGIYQITLNVTNVCAQDSHTSTIAIDGPAYAVALSPESDSASGAPGDSLVYNLTVHNTGNASDTFDLAYADLNGWTAGVSPASVALPSGGSAQVTVTVGVPIDAGDGDWDVSTVSATSQGDPAVSDSSTLTTTAVVTQVCQPITGVDFTWSPPNPQTGQAITFTASYQPPTATLPITFAWSFGDGDAGAGNPVYHTYTASGTYSVSLTGTNACGGPVGASHALTVTGEPFTPTYGVALAPPTASASGAPGDSLTYSLTVHNAGNVADTFDLVYADLNGWTSGLTPASANLLPGGSAQVSVTVSIPGDAGDGDWDVSTVSATSQGDPALSAVSTLTTTAVAPTCVEVSGVELTRTTEGSLQVGDLVQLSADVAPDDFTAPYTYTVDYGDGTPPTMAGSGDDPLQLSHAFGSAGTFTVELAVWNCEMSQVEAKVDAVQVVIAPAEELYAIYLPIILRSD